jgi:pimeloyl-ACP methyl ester carboxylesterase
LLICFSWDEIAKYDLPATVNKMIAITGVQQVYFVGHSQGGGVGYAQLSQDPEFAKKIKMFAPLAPAVYLDALTGPLKLLAPFSEDLDVNTVIFILDNVYLIYYCSFSVLLIVLLYLRYICNINYIE